MINYPTPQEALKYAEDTGRLATKEEALERLTRYAPEEIDWSIFVSKAMRHAIADLVDLDRLDQYDDNFFTAIFPPHQQATTRRLLKMHGLESTVTNRAKIMREAARMVKNEQP